LGIVLKNWATIRKLFAPLASQAVYGPGLRQKSGDWC